ncbi:MAG: LD-carboxypeptidase [Lachnospiraceae bacterium]|nr:LD-carboxypeptidase [Lachnospiraceae bacterium]
MRYPEFIREGGTIGLPAPSFAPTTEPYLSLYKNALKTLEVKGYHLKPGPNATADCGVGISNTPEACGRELTEMYLDETDALISLGGGELMCEILDYVDFDRIKAAKPKWFMGYSDNTNFAYPLATICDTAAIYGPCFGAFGAEPWHESVKDALDVFTGKTLTVHSYDKYETESLCDEVHPLAPINATEPRLHGVYDGKDFYPKGTFTGELRAEGRFLGGCMDCLVNLLGTKYDQTKAFLERYREQKIIWFLEACDLNVFAIRRAMWEMDQAGWFASVSAFLIGRPLNGGQMINLDACEAYLPYARKYGVPMILDMDLGHVDPQMPLIVGANAQVLIKGNDAEIQMELT